MPLTRDPHLAMLRRHGRDIVFTMCDGTRVVACRMHESFISAFANVHYGLSAEEIFRKERDYVEKIASLQYDGGNEEPCVSVSDLLHGKRTRAEP